MPIGTGLFIESPTKATVACQVGVRTAIFGIRKDSARYAWI